MEFTCYARIAPSFARVVFYQTFVDMVDAAIRQRYAATALKLFDDICGDVWRECNRRHDMQAWELFKLHANRYCHTTGELARDRVLTFVWAGSVY